jgi:hypothetical protein
MKKFIITEEEKSRILGMHQFATSRQYLMENVRAGVTKDLLTQIANRINANIERAKTKGKKISSVVSVVQEGNYKGVNAFVLKYGNTTFLSEYKGYKFSDGVLDDHAKTKPPYEAPLKFWGEGITSVVNNNAGMPKELQQLSDDSANILKIYNTWASQFRQTKP